VSDTRYEASRLLAGELASLARETTETPVGSLSLGAKRGE